MPAMRNTFTMIIWRARVGTPREAALPVRMYHVRGREPVP